MNWLSIKFIRIMRTIAVSIACMFGCLVLLNFFSGQLGLQSCGLIELCQTFAVGMLSLVVAILYMLGYLVLRHFFQPGYIHKGQYDCLMARKRGDTAIAKIVSVDTLSNGNKKCIYSYKVNGKYYTFTEWSREAPNTLEICYDRNRRNSRINPDHNSILDYWWVFSTLLVFLLTMVLLFD